MAVSLRTVRPLKSENSAVNIASNATIFSSTAGQTLTIGNAAGTSLFTLGANTVTFDGPGNTFINSDVGVTGDTGGLIKNGTGKLTISAKITNGNGNNGRHAAAYAAETSTINLSPKGQTPERPASDQP